MKVNLGNNLEFNGRMLCKGCMSALRKKHINKPFSPEESRNLIGTSDLSGEYDSESTFSRLFSVDTKNITGIDSSSIHFVSDDNSTYGALSYQPKGATNAERKLN